MIFKILAPASGSNSIRWLGGQQLRMPSPPLSSDKNDRHYKPSTEDNPEFQEWKDEFKEVRQRHFFFKSIVWFAGLSIIIAALVMSVYGVDSLTNTLEAGRESIQIVRTLASDAQGIVDTVITENQSLSKEVYGMLEEVNGMCPLVKDPLCDDITNITTCDISSILGDDLNEIFKTAGGHFVDGEDSEYFREIVNAKNGLEDVQVASRDIDQSAAHINWALSLSMVMSLLLAMLCILLLCGILCPEVPKVLQCIRSKFMIPTFVVLVVFAYVFSLVFVTASIATADVCVYHNKTDNIDERLTAVLTQSETVEELLGGKENQNLVVEFISFYMHQCPVEMLPSEILEQLNYLQVGVPLIKDFGTIVEDSTELIRGVCGFGVDQIQDLVSVADTLQNQLCSLVAIVTEVRDFVQCGNWYPLYEKTVYEALCYDGTTGFAYVATTQFVIVFMAFVILTFRVAFFEIQVGDEFFDFVDDEGYYSGSIDKGEANNERSSSYMSLRNKLGFFRSSSPSSSQYSSSESSISETMEESMIQLRKGQQQQRSNRQSDHSYLGKAPATTKSLSSSSPEQQLPLSPPPRNSIYPSRRFVKGEATVVSPTRMAATGNSPGLEGGEEGVEVVEKLSQNRSDAAVGKNSKNSSKKKKKEKFASPTSIICGGGFRSPFADATSLWAKHWNNIDYVDSEDGDNDRGSYDGSGSYSYGDDFSSMSGGDNSSREDWLRRGR